MAGTYTAYNLRIILILTLGSLTFGYAYSVISGTLGQPGFLDYFNLKNDAAYTQTITGTINGLLCAGAVFGSLNVGWMCEARGRKETMYLTCLVNIVGEALQAGSVNLGMFFAARFIGGWGIGMAVVLIPLYQAEICESQNPPVSQSTDRLAQQRHQARAAFWWVSMVPLLSLVTPLLAGWAWELITLRIWLSNGAFQLQWPVSPLWPCCYAATGSRNLLDGVRLTTISIYRDADHFSLDERPKGRSVGNRLSATWWRQR